MALLSGAQILQATDLPFEDVDVPEWGGAVRVRTLTGAEKDAWEESRLQGKGKNRRTNFKNFRASLVALCAVDENFKRIFQEKDIEALGKKSAKALDRVYEAATKLNGIGEEDQDFFVEGSAKTPSADSSSS